MLFAGAIVFRYMPGLAEGMEGVKAGETREIRVTFPDKLGPQGGDLEGTKAIFEVEAVEIRVSTPRSSWPREKPHPSCRVKIPHTVVCCLTFVGTHVSSEPPYLLNVRPRPGRGRAYIRSLDVPCRRTPVSKRWGRVLEVLLKSRLHA